MSGDDMVLVGRYIRLYEAEIAHGVLEDAGIFSHIPDRSVGGVAPHYSYGTGGVRLLVRQDDLEKARAALASLADDTVDEPAPDVLPGAEPVAREGTVGKPASSRRELAAVSVLGGLVVVMAIAALVWNHSPPQRLPAEYEPCKSARLERRWDEVIDRCTALTEVAPRLGPGWAYLSEALDEKGHYDQAVAAARRAASIGPTGWCYLARALHRAGRPDESLDAMKQFHNFDLKAECNVQAPSGVLPIVAAASAGAVAAGGCEQ